MHSPRLEIVKKSRLKPTAVTPVGEQLQARRALVTGRASLVVAALVGALALTAGVPARGADGEESDALAGLPMPNAPIICTKQTYALCAGASCFVYNDVAYCTCDVKKGNSISSPLNFRGGNICTLNAGGVGNGYMASTFSLPNGLKAPFGDKALYKCPRTFYTAYAKCDGGICFTSTTGNFFPGTKTPLGDKKIVCSCPIERENPFQGLEIIGPYPCQNSFFNYCGRIITNNGSTLFDGTSIGSTETGTRLLYGYVPPLNTCEFDQ